MRTFSQTVSFPGAHNDNDDDPGSYDPIITVYIPGAPYSFCSTRVELGIACGHDSGQLSRVVVTMRDLLIAVIHPELKKFQADVHEWIGFW
jgi:hypothetical protein